MRTIKSVLTVIVLVSLFSVASAQKLKTVSILTSAQCDMCEKKIEQNISYEKGVKDVDLDVKSKKLTVTFKANKTDINRIRQAVSKLGYDADGVKADSKAYAGLPDCCKKPKTKKLKKSSKKSGCGSAVKRDCRGHRSAGGCGK